MAAVVLRLVPAVDRRGEPPADSVDEKSEAGALSRGVLKKCTEG